MPLNDQAILAHKFDDEVFALNDRDCMLYALSLGVGRDPMDRDELRYVYEKDLLVFPTMPVVLARPDRWYADPLYRINAQMMVHGTQKVVIHKPLQVGQPIVGGNHIVEVLDKGAEGGAVIFIGKTLRDQRTGDLLATSEGSIFCRADGGFGGKRAASYEFKAVPERAPDLSADMPTDPNSALYYRLNGDRNPLHSDPDFAKQAGFERPILHGLCTFGVAAHALMRHIGAPQKLQLASIETRFSKPVMPGETVSFDMWRLDEGIAFRARVASREAVVLDRGFATFR